MNLKMTRFSLLAVTILLMAYSVQAKDVNSNAGTSAFSFLKINVSARAVGMGGAFTGLADDESALYYNPAGIASIEDPKYIVGYHNYFFDMQSGFLGYVKPLKFDRSLGFYLSYLNYGSFTQTNDIGDVNGEFGGGDLLFAVTFAQRKNYRISYGATAKFIYESIDSYSATGVAIDLGIKYNSDRGKFGAGLMLQNLGKQLSALGETKDKLPTSLRSGIFVIPKGIPITLTSDLILPFDNDLIFAIGADYYNFKPFYVRMGWNSFGSNYKATNSDASLTGMSFGVGFDVNKMQVSYAFTPSTSTLETVNPSIRSV